MAEIKETKAQKVERLKREKNSWEHIDEIRSFARNGFSSIPSEWLGTYFRSWGVYTQGDGAGVTGGVGGEGKSTPFFMMRIRIPNGLLTTQQLHTVADISEKYARGVADITVRQNIQLHWVTIKVAAGRSRSSLSRGPYYHRRLRRRRPRCHGLPACWSRCRRNL